MGDRYTCSYLRINLLKQLEVSIGLIISDMTKNLDARDLKMQSLPYLSKRAIFQRNTMRQTTSNSGSPILRQERNMFNVDDNLSECSTLWTPFSLHKAQKFKCKFPMCLKKKNMVRTRISLIGTSSCHLKPNTNWHPYFVNTLLPRSTPKERMMASFLPLLLQNVAPP